MKAVKAVGVVAVVLALFACGNPQAELPISGLEATFGHTTEDGGRIARGEVEVTWTPEGHYRVVDLYYWLEGDSQPSYPQKSRVDEAAGSATLNPADGFSSSGTLNILVDTKTMGGESLGTDTLTVAVEENIYPRKPELSAWEVPNQDEIAYDWFVYTGADPDSLTLYRKIGDGSYESLGSSFATGHTDPESEAVPAGTAVGTTFTYYMEGSYSDGETVSSDTVEVTYNDLEQTVTSFDLQAPVLNSFTITDEGSYFDTVVDYDDTNGDYPVDYTAYVTLRSSGYPAQLFSVDVDNPDPSWLQLDKSSIEYDVVYDVEFYVVARYGSQEEQSETITKEDYLDNTSSF